MPLYSEHITNMYYTPTYNSLPYNYSSSPYGSSYSASYLNPGGNYSSHSSLGGYSRTPVSSRWISSGRSYAPMLSTISEKGTSSPVRINSPRRVPVTTRSYTTSFYPITRPININTADIDVSHNKYRNKPPSSNISSVTKRSPSFEKERTISSSHVDDKPKTGVDSSPGPLRSTIKRDRPVVRLHTVKRKDRDSPRKPIEISQIPDDKIIIQSEATTWRDRLAEDLEYKEKKEKKTIAEKLVEKFTLKEDGNGLAKRKEVIEIQANNTPEPIKQSETPTLQSRRFSIEMLAEQATLLDSLIRRENLSTATLDLSKVGAESGCNKTELDDKEPRKRTFIAQTNPITTTKSDHSLNCRINVSKTTRHSIKRKSLRKSSSGDCISTLSVKNNSIKSENLPTIEEKVLCTTNDKNNVLKKKSIRKPKITSSVEVTSPTNPLRFVIENVIVEEKPLKRKKDIVFSSVIEVKDEPIKKIERVKANNEPSEGLKIKIKPNSEKNKKKNIENVESPEPDDGNFWNKIGKRETVYLIHRKKEIDDTLEKNKRLIFWFPDQEDSKLENDETKFNDAKDDIVIDSIDNCDILNVVDRKDETSIEVHPETTAFENDNKLTIENKRDVKELNNVDLNRENNASVIEIDNKPESNITDNLKSVASPKMNAENIETNISNKPNVSSFTTNQTKSLDDSTDDRIKETHSLSDIGTKDLKSEGKTKPKVVKKIRKSKEKVIESPGKFNLDEKSKICTDVQPKSILTDELQVTNVVNNSNLKNTETQTNTPLTTDVTLIDSLKINDNEIIVNTKPNGSQEVKRDKQIINVVETAKDFDESIPVVIVNIENIQLNAILSNIIDKDQKPLNESKEDDLKNNLKRASIKKPAQDTGANLLFTNKKPVKNIPAPITLIATPRPLQKKPPQVIRSSSSSETSSSEDSSDEEESSESSNEYYETENNIDGRTSTGSNDSGFDSSAPVSPSGFSFVKKGADHPSTSSGTANAQPNTYIVERELEQSTAYGLFRKTGRFTPPARTIPRFRKYNIEDFQFIKVLGKGSFGKVMLAELRDTEYYYAVKCLKKDVVLEDDDVECTLIERKVLALGTNHPYLCHLFATFQTDSHLFFVMEYLNGGDLMFHIQQSGRFPEPRARFYAAEIVSGLKFLHKRGIVYRDLKLDNILLDFDGNVRIADFGMCKLQVYLDKTADTFCGTPDYMAPEIIKGVKYNQTVDWWSFGVLLYEMLIGQSPFSGCDEDELFWSICNEMPSYPRFLSAESLSILTRLLDKDARTRLGGTECMHGEIRDQEFFKPINWEKLERRELEAPFKPRVRHPLDTQYFDRAFTGERPRLTIVEPQVLRSMDQEPFRGFSYTNPNATDR